MSYTVWLDGTRIGETSLELSHGEGRRAGVFHPTASGLAALPGITAMGPALLDAGRMWSGSGLDADDVDVDVDRVADTIFETPEGHRILEAAKVIARLELHGSRGELVPWESVLISDMNELAAIAARVPSARRVGTAPAPIADPVRYFISVRLRSTNYRGGQPSRTRRPS